MRRYLLLFFHLFVFAQVPQAYKDLGEAMQKEVPLFQALAQEPRFNDHQDQFELYMKELETAFSLGNRLDEEIARIGKNEESLRKDYLNALRTLQMERKTLKELYYQEVLSSIKRKDTGYLLFLLDNAQMLIDENSRLKSQVISYASDNIKLKQHKVILTYQEEKELDERSYAFAQKMQEEYKAYQKVLREQEALKLRSLLVSKKKGGVIVYAEEAKGNITFVIENLFEMHVSATLYINDISGYVSEETLPYKVVLKPKERRKIVNLVNISKKKEVGNFTSHISWAKGAVNAMEDKSFLYALPFHESFEVSQGFNGRTSHQGRSQYAVDFAMPIGTPVYAARGGKIVEIVQHHDQHGTSQTMRQYANYVIIEHDDKTLGRYFHLKHQGVKVKLGQTVKRGELIALSGNTGRTSGAHLHFVVTKAEESGNEYNSVSIPIKFKCKEGIVDNPIKGYSYCYVK